MAYSLYQIIRDINGQPAEYVSTPETKIMAAVIVEAIHDYLCWRYTAAGVPGVTTIKTHNYSTAKSFLFHTAEPFNEMCEAVDLDPDTLRQKIRDLEKDPDTGLALLCVFREEQEALVRDECPDCEGSGQDQGCRPEYDYPCPTCNGGGAL